MEVFLIFLAVFWILIPILAAKKKQQEKEKAAQQRAAMQRAAQVAAQKQASAQQAPMRTAPITPTVRPTAQPAFEGIGSNAGTGSLGDSGSREGTASPEEGTAKHTIASKLRELSQSPQHVVSASSVSGHAHEETSMTDIKPDCPPDAAKPSVAAVVPIAAQSTFQWDQTQVLNGIVMSEILGPCLALRE